MTRITMVQAKRVLASSVALLLCLYPVQAKSLPIDGKVISGSVTIKQPNTNTLNINQASDKAIINWKGFNINVNELVKFNQLKSSSVALNRVIGVDPSVILGKLAANGRVFIVNPNGIFFGPNSSVDVSGLFATTLGIKDTDFLAGKYNFMQDPTKNPSYVVNQGQIKVSDDGFVFLVAPGVKNENLIIANLGKVVLASGQQFTVDFMGDGLINFVVDGKVVDKVIGPEGNPLPSAVSNSGTIKADGGQVILTARASKDIFSSVVNNSGVIEAKSLVNRGGVIRLEGSDPVDNTGQVGWQANLAKVQNAEGAVINSGTLDVSAIDAGAAQGQVTLAGELVGVSGTILARGADGAQGGKVLISSTDQTAVTNSALINTSGVDSSSAGNVVIWSDKTTLFDGTILARGGDLGGNAGNAEISGHEHLLVTGYADLRAPFGAVGTLVLDPGTVFICHLTASCVGSSGGLDTFSDDYINAQLVLGNLTITTATASGTNGFGPDIIFLDPAISISWATTIFTLTAGWNIVVQGSISGGTGSTLNVNFGQSGNVVPYTLDLSGANTVTAVTVNLIGESPMDIIVGQNGANAWNITGANSGSLNGMNFSGIEVLTGGTGADTFTLNAGVPTFNGSIGGGGAANTNTLAATNGTNAWAITGPSSGTLNTTTSFSEISNLIGGSGADNFSFTGSGNVSSITGGLGFDTADFSALAAPVTLTLGGSSTESVIGNGGTLIGQNVDNTWNITGSNAGNVTDGTGALLFSGFNNLTGGNLNDSFVLAGGSLGGAIDGGLGTNTLTGGNVSNTWNITGANSGTVTGIAGGFTNIHNLVGGLAADNFIFSGSGNVSSIAGGLGFDTADFSAVAAPVTLTLGGSSTDSVIGNGGTLIGSNTDNIWTISGTNAGDVNDGTGIVAFTNFINLTGGNLNDAFILAGGSLSGAINGGAGNNTLTGGNLLNTWNITGPNSGAVTGIGAGFANIQNLTGGSGVDTFTFTGSGSLAGSLSGGAGTDSANYAGLATPANVIIGPSGIENLVGNGGTLTGPNNNNTWTINGANAGTVNDGVNTTTFTGFNSLTGGTAADSFTLAGGILGGSLNGGGGIDTLIGNNGANTWTITGINSGTVTGIAGGFTNIQNLTGGSGADNFVFANGASVMGRIDGGGGTGNDVLDWSAYVTGRSVALTAVGSFDGFQGSEVSVAGGFDNINDVRGSATATNDALIVNGTTPVSFTATQITQGTATINYAQFDSLVAPQTTGTIIVGSFKDPPPIISPGALIFDTTTVDGNLSATANGAVTQIGPLTVSGGTTIDAATNTITLNNPLNDFQGTLNIQGSNIALTDANTLNIGVFKSNGGGASIVSAGPMVAVSPDPSLSLLFNTDPKTNLDLIGDSQLRAGGDIGSKNAPLVVSLGSSTSVAARIAHLVSGPPRFLTVSEIDSVDALALFLDSRLIGGNSVATTSSTLSDLCDATGGCEKLISVMTESLVLEEPSRIRLDEELKRRLQISEGFEDMPLAVAAVTLDFRPAVGLVSLFDGSSQSDS